MSKSGLASVVRRVLSRILSLGGGGSCIKHCQGGSGVMLLKKMFRSSGIVSDAI